MKRSLLALLSFAATGFLASHTSAFAQNWTPEATNQSFSSCTSSLCIDAPPQGRQGLDGSGGFGWDSKENRPVTWLPTGKPAPFVVTVMQPSSVPNCGAGNLTITLTYSSRDFSLNPTDSTGNTGTNPFDRGGVETFTYSGDFLCHTDQSVTFTLTPQHATNTALVTATVNVGSQQASETFPVGIYQKH
jgi:hypothetical protein